MANIYDQFNSEDLKKELAEVAANDGKREYKEVPCGDYEVSISHLELKASKAGNPMISCRFHILEGEFKKIAVANGISATRCPKEVVTVIHFVVYAKLRRHDRTFFIAKKL